MLKFNQIDEAYKHLTPLKDDKWFEVFQVPLLGLANTDYGRDLLCINKSLPPLIRMGKHLVEGIQDIKADGSVEFITDFRVGCKWGNVIRDRWPEFSKELKRYYQVEGGKLLRPVLNWNGEWLAAAATDTFRPDPHPETSSFDGWVKAPNAGAQTWGFVRGHSGSGGIPDDTGVEDMCSQIRAHEVTTDRYHWLGRALFVYDTSPLPDGNKITGATKSIHGSSKSNVPLGPAVSVNVEGTNPTSNTSITDTDYSTFVGTAFSTKISYASYNVSGDNDFVLNASGIAGISKTGPSPFGTRDHDYDFPNNTPAWVANNNSQLRCYYADETGTSKDPKLVVVHVAGRLSRYHNLNGLGGQGQHTVNPLR